MFKQAIICMTVTLALAAGCTKSEKPAVSSIAPDFTLQDLTGKAVRLADFKGKVVLVEFWATWCPPCRESIPGMERVHEAYQSKGLVVLGVSMDSDGPETLRSFARERGIKYSILQGSDEVADKYMVHAIPTMFLVNKEGMIARQYLGGADGDVLDKDIQALL